MSAPLDTQPYGNGLLDCEASAKAPVPRVVFQEIDCAGRAFGRFGHLGGHLAGSSQAMRGQNVAEVSDQCFQGAFQKAPAKAR
jgi:hypothetical protein